MISFKETLMIFHMYSKKKLDHHQNRVKHFLLWIIMAEIKVNFLKCNV